MDFKRFLRSEWDRIAGYACLAAGVVALIVGFFGVRHAADVIDEISYLVSGGIGAMFLLGVGATLLLSADLHDDFRKLHRVEQKLDRIHQVLAAEHPELIDLAGGGAEGPGDGAAVRAPSGNGHTERGSRLAGAPGALAVRKARRVSAAGAVVAGVLFLAGAVRTATESSTDHMAGGVGLALTGALLAAVVAGAMVGQLKGLLEQRKLAVLGPWSMEEAGPGGGSEAPAADRVWVVDGLSLYHRAGCRALDGRAAREHDRAGLAAGLGPCGLCEP